MGLTKNSTKATINISRVTVVVFSGYPDKIWMHTDLPSNLRNVPHAELALEMLQGTGAAWVRRHLGVEPEVIEG